MLACLAGWTCAAVNPLFAPFLILPILGLVTRLFFHFGAWVQLAFVSVIIFALLEPLMSVYGRIGTDYGVFFPVFGGLVGYAIALTWWRVNPRFTHRMVHQLAAVWAIAIGLPGYVQLENILGFGDIPVWLTSGFIAATGSYLSIIPIGSET